MKVAGITTDGDWVFGRGLASYKTASDAIRQNIVTRLRSFTDDWFLDVLAGSPWFDLIGRRGGVERIERQAEKIVLETVGVRSITFLTVTEDRKTRDIIINFSYTDVFDLPTTQQVSILQTGA